MEITQKYRPRRFQDVHQPHVTRLLQSQVKTGEFTTSYLFSGPPGVGKTTLGRILASAILDDDTRRSGSDEVNSESPVVKRIAAHAYPDLHEINCANHNGVDDVREMIIDRSRLQPKESSFRVYLLDEVHRLSVNAQDALLKILEEPPSHIIFILCSTDPMKLIETIRSRCHWHILRRVPEVVVTDVLKNICDNEGWDYSINGLKLIAKETRGGMRDALKLLDKLHMIDVTEENVRETLGKGPKGLCLSLLTSIIRGDRKTALLGVDSTITSGYAIESLLEDTALLACEIMESFATEKTLAPDLAALKTEVSPRMMVLIMDGCLKAYGLLRQNLPKELTVKAELMSLIPQVATAKPTK